MTVILLYYVLVVHLMKSHSLSCKLRYGTRPRSQLLFACSQLFFSCRPAWGQTGQEHVQSTCGCILWSLQLLNWDTVIDSLSADCRLQVLTNPRIRDWQQDNQSQSTVNVSSDLYWPTRGKSLYMKAAWNHNCDTRNTNTVKTPEDNQYHQYEYWFQWLSVIDYRKKKKWIIYHHKV